VLAKIALDLINEATVLAFDEVQLVDIAGAVGQSLETMQSMRLMLLCIAGHSSEGPYMVLATRRRSSRNKQPTSK
jgi:hypothetical protein